MASSGLKQLQKLLKDIEELSLSQSLRNLWYERAERLKAKKPELYHIAMEAAREYNDNVTTHKNTTTHEGELMNALTKRTGMTELRDMSLPELSAAIRTEREEIAKRRRAE